MDSATSDDGERLRGLAYALAAYGSWGIVPVFWKQLGAVPSSELVLHRALWSGVFFAVWLALQGRMPEARRAISSWKTARWFLLSAFLIGNNWFFYLYAVATDRIVEASLGYFINPLVNVALGAWVLGEELTGTQKAAVGLATLGVAGMAVVTGGLPWLALVLAASFGGYGLVRKQSPSDAMLGSTLELGLLGGSAAFGVMGLEFWGSGSLGDVDLWTHVLLLSTGVVTALPLLWFSQAARRLPLSTMGFVQYVSPTGQLLIGVLIYAEPFDGGRAAAFSVIWLACALFSWDLARRHRG